MRDVHVVVVYHVREVVGRQAICFEKNGVFIGFFASAGLHYRSEFAEDEIFILGVTVRNSEAYDVLLAFGGPVIGLCS